MIKIATIDYETKAIQKRPNYPPEPVGVAIKEPGKADYYMAWGHPTENNCTKAQAIRKLKELYSKYKINTHNGKFDLEVGEKFMDLPLVPKFGWEDSMLLAFLHNPREANLKLKPLADKYLDLPPEEQDKLRDWIFENVPGAKKAKTKWGQYICLAPGKLVGRYAKGDTKRTDKLQKKFFKYVKENGMLEQYDVEKRSIIKTIEMEREGVPIDYKNLEPELEKSRKALKRAERAIFKKLGEINLNSPKQKIEAFERAGLVDEWEYTEKGNPMTSIDSLMKVCTDKKLIQQLNRFSKFTKVIGTYMEPWLDSALENNGRFFPWFNTIKGENDKGTYTGRLSSNFQQVPREPKDNFTPFLRNFVIADSRSQCLFNRDFSAQEIRILAHFEDGQLLDAYLLDPTMDVHDFVGKIVASNSGMIYNPKKDRVPIKSCNFLVVYGGGAPALAKNLGIELSEGKQIITAHGKALPGVQELKDELRAMSQRGESFRTAGGRLYDFEPSFEWVAPNTLIQGSAADHTKRALLNIDDMIKTKYSGDARIMLTVHDEFMNSAPKKLKKAFMADFKEAMEYDKLFDLPMLSDGKIGQCWGKMEKVK